MNHTDETQTRIDHTRTRSLLLFNDATVVATAGAVFAIAAGVTLYFVHSMGGGMRMPGGWTMSMMWMPMPGQHRIEAAIMFVVMWQAMMVAMMLPSSLPMLLLYRRAVLFKGTPHVGRLTWMVAFGYFIVWLLFGCVVYLAGSSISSAAMASDVVSRMIPVATAAVLVGSGVYQLTPWKSACLRHCRDPLSTVASHLEGGESAAFRLGLHHGLYCAACCWALMAMQLMMGIMSLPSMIAIAAVIAGEKLFQPTSVVVWTTGIAAIAFGVVILLRSLT